MMRHDEALLWEYAARELPSEDARLVQHHLTECPECQEKLTDVRTARGALEAVKGSDYAFSYTKTDGVLAKAVEAKMAKAVFTRPWVLGLSGALVAAGLALVVYGFATRPSASSSPTVAEVAIPVAAPAPAVEQAHGLSVIGAQTRVLGNGATLASGDVLRTDGKGEGTLRLPEGTRLKLAASSQLSLTRAEADDVTLSLDRGHVAVAASHARRKGFVVHTQGLMVTVVGTTFAVTSSRDGVDVAVSEGRVSVEPPVGLPQFVGAGQKLHFDSRWRSSRSGLNGADKRELNGLAESSAPPPAVAAPPRTSPAVPSAGGPAPRAEEMKALVGEAVDEFAPLPLPAKPVVVAVAPVPAPVPDVAPAPPPPPSKPDMSGLDVPLLASPVESVGRAPAAANEWAAYNSKPAEAPVTPGKASKLGGDEIAEDAESLFLQRAERSLSHGTCERYLVGLEELAMDAKRTPRSEKARIFRARCFDALMKTKESELEYRRYLRDYPNGKFIDEARQITSGK